MRDFFSLLDLFIKPVVYCETVPERVSECVYSVTMPHCHTDTTVSTQSSILASIAKFGLHCHTQPPLPHAASIATVSAYIATLALNCNTWPPLPHSAPIVLPHSSITCIARLCLFCNKVMHILLILTSTILTQQTILTNASKSH